MNSKVILLVLCAFVGGSVGIRCYTCTFSTVESDRSCLTVTDNTLIINCPTYCAIIRQEYLDPEGEIASFYRGCPQSSEFLNNDVIDSTFRTYHRACTNDLCNTGDGIQSLLGINLSPTPEYVGVNLLVPPAGSATNMQISTLLFSVLIAINIYNY